MAKLLTLKEISQVLGIPESSLRKYREFFTQFIPSVGKGRSMRYRTEAIEVFKDIRHLREELQMPWDAITDKLAEMYPIDATPEPREHEAPRPIPKPAPSEKPEPAQAAPAQVSEKKPAPAPDSQSEQLAPLESTAVDSIPHGAGTAYLKKIAAISEKQMMTVNAMAIELVQAVDSIRAETRAESERLQRHLFETLNAMSRSFKEMNTEEKKMLNDITSRIYDVRQMVAKIDKSSDRTVQFVEVEAQLKTVQRKLEQREKLIQEYKNSFEVLKRENSELRAFKARHVDLAEDKVREVKGMKKTPFMKKIFGPKV